MTPDRQQVPIDPIEPTGKIWTQPERKLIDSILNGALLPSKDAHEIFAPIDESIGFALTFVNQRVLIGTPQVEGVALSVWTELYFSLVDAQRQTVAYRNHWIRLTTLRPVNELESYPCSPKELPDLFTVMTTAINYHQIRNAYYSTNIDYITPCFYSILGPGRETINGFQGRISQIESTILSTTDKTQGLTALLEDTNQYVKSIKLYQFVDNQHFYDSRRWLDSWNTATTLLSLKDESVFVKTFVFGLSK